MKKYLAECFGTFWLVFGGCGSAVLAAAFPGLGIGFTGVALAFGLTVLTMAYAVGPISGGHFNPAVSVGLGCAGRVSWGDVVSYIGAQVVGAVVAAAATPVGGVGDRFTLAGVTNTGSGSVALINTQQTVNTFTDNQHFTFLLPGTSAVWGTKEARSTNSFFSASTKYTKQASQPVVCAASPTISPRASSSDNSELNTRLTRCNTDKLAGSFAMGTSSTTVILRA